MNWTKMCLIFAEAANKYVGPTDEGTYGYSARQAIAWLRNRPTNDDEPGLGTFGDPYLDECAAEATTFEGLVKMNGAWKLVSKATVTTISAAGPRMFQKSTNRSTWQRFQINRD